MFTKAIYTLYELLLHDQSESGKVFQVISYFKVILKIPVITID